MAVINERGNKKWQGFMMPEHIELLNEYWESQEDIEKSLLSEDQLEEIKRTVAKAIECRLEVDIQYYENKRIKVIEGIINSNGKDRS
ncbi:YolD-like family protein [Terrihalobacillus insolitus]|uniref:YolD-like family protein n=1 Tax=Terrihalobacillus insolitus TaxID=2950438 RepID=UPI0023425228|nr:YolD-like family protein [Terrihalobacillus insolitus]MDC3414932.1 YolD-like family protein [Terrihalobacillus insolitus]